MKLGNFQSLDPLYTGKGLSRGGKLDLEVWEEFDADTDRLDATANAIKESANWTPEIRKKYLAELEDEEFPEGKILTTIHKHKERNSKAAEQKKRKILEERVSS